MPGERSLSEVLHNLLSYGDLSFRDFVELALYHPEFGYYSRPSSPVGKDADYITAPLISPVFSFALGRLIHEFVGRGDGEVSSVVDVGCGDGSLILSLYGEGARFFGVDRSLARVREPNGPVRFVTSLEEVPRDGQHLILSNELFDALPFTRLVRRGEHLHELWVSSQLSALSSQEVGGGPESRQPTAESFLDWKEHEAAPAWEDYFAERGIELEEGQFADVSLDWAAQYEELCRVVTRGLIVTFDYGFPERQLFHPRIRRFGTAASYSQQRVHRDLLAKPGEQDLTAHINFSDLQRAGERAGFRTLFFDRQAKFLLSLGITEHELFRPVTDLEVGSLQEGVDLLDARDAARRLVLPDGIGEDIRVLVQGKDVADDWSFQRALFQASGASGQRSPER